MFDSPNHNNAKGTPSIPDPAAEQLGKKSEIVLLGTSSATPQQYPAELISELGKEKDCVLAQRFGLANSTISNLRRRYGIDRYSSYKHSVRAKRQAQDTTAPKTTSTAYPEELISCLGKEKDCVLAKRFGFTPSTICTLRNRLGIDRYSTNKYNAQARIRNQAAPSPKTSFPAEHEPLLGTMRDSHLAAQLGIGLKVVIRRRLQLGIQSFAKTGGVLWTPNEIALLGALTDSELANKLGDKVNPNVVEKKRKELGIPRVRRGSVWTKETVALLGTMPDAELAIKVGCGLTTKAVQKKRAKLSIACFAGPKNKPEPKLNECWTPEIISRLGTVNDYVLSSDTGIGRTSITRMRLSLGIEPAKRRRSKCQATRNR